MPCDAEAAEPQPEILWKLLMQAVHPTDLLRSIIDQAVTRADLTGRTIEVTAGGQHIVLQGCTVTIHQHVQPAAGPHLSAA